MIDIKPGIEFWRSDEAFDLRCAGYLYEMLMNDRDLAREPFATGKEPLFSAICGYDRSTDQLMWVEVKAPTHVKDYLRARPDWVSGLAKALIAP